MTVLASVSLPDGREVVLRSFLRRGIDPSLGTQCLSLSGLDEYTRQCGRAFEDEGVVTTAPVSATAIAQISDSANLEVFGSTSRKTAQVRLSHGDGTTTVQTRAVLIRVDGEVVLERAGIPAPFGFFFAELPANTSTVTATALDSGGGRLGSASFDQLVRTMHPHVFIAEQLPGDEVYDPN